MFNDLAANNWAISNTIFEEDFCSQIAKECHSLYNQGLFKQASIGHGVTKKTESSVRGDSTFWIEDIPSSTTLQKKLWVSLQDLKDNLNKNFYLGLKWFETHFAIYPPGAGYDKHIDNHKGSGARKITFLLYLNENWQKGDGGELSLYQPEQENVLIATVEPKLGTFLLFRSDLFPHQVEKSLRPRLSITGWFRNDL